MALSLPRLRLVHEIDDDIVFEAQIEYTYCIHCFRLYDPTLPTMSVKLPHRIPLWWHAHCPKLVTHVPCSLNLCDGSGSWPSLYTGQDTVCICKR